MNLRPKALVLVVAGACLATDSMIPVRAGDVIKPSSSNPNPSAADTYIEGPGDEVMIELLDIPELTGKFSIGPDGTFYLPRLRALYVEGLTVEELRNFLSE